MKRCFEDVRDIFRKTSMQLCNLNNNHNSVGDCMILVSWDEIATRSVRTDFTLGLHGEIIFRPVKAGQFPPAICFDLFTFSFNFPFITGIWLFRILPECRFSEFFLPVNTFMTFTYKRGENRGDLLFTFVLLNRGVSDVKTIYFASTKQRK